MPRFDVVADGGAGSLRKSQAWAWCVLWMVAASTLASCDRAGSAIARWERWGPAAGLGTTSARNVVLHATRVARTVAGELHTGCVRPRVEPADSGLWTTRIVWTRKARAVASERVATTETWAHQGPTPILWERRLTAHVPDGRVAVRSASLVNLGDECAAGLDGRLVVDPQRERCIERLEQSRTAAVDELLALTGDPQFAGCASLAPPFDARVRWALEASDGVSFDRGRTGWVQWSDGRYAQVIVHFEESWSAQAVVPPDDPPLPVIDEVVDWRAIDAFVENGRESGWLREGRAIDAQAP